MLQPEPSSMTFAAILGQEPAVRTLEHALASGKVHHAYRFEGPPGVGKGLAALALARALLCEQPTPLACETCDACKRAATFARDEPQLPAHPDLLIVERGLYRSVIPANEATGISIEQVRRIVLSRIGFPPHEGRAVVCIVRGAVVARVLTQQGLDPKLAELAQGSMEQALALADAEALAVREQFAAQVLNGIDAPDLAGALAFADKQKLERHELSELLGHLAQVIALKTREVVATLPEEARRLSRRYEVVRGALADLERNVGPQLALEAMMAKLRRA